MSTLLILVPTGMEMHILQPLLQDVTDRTAARLELCGFGPIAAAARTARLIELHRPRQIVLIGIAGALSDRLPIGTAHHFTRVACYGIGAGTGDQFTTAGELNWPHWEEHRKNPPHDPVSQDTIRDVITLHGHRSESADICGIDGLSKSPPSEDPPTQPLLLTCCAASASPADVILRIQKFPSAVAEDMEGFAVAAACRMAAVRLDIIRGISNRAGVRTKTQWRISEALHAAAELARHQIECAADSEFF